MKSKPKVDRWIAVRRGDIYCAPACGGGCTHAAFVKANADAKNLCAELEQTTGIKGWTTHVWENLGWHHKAVSSCGRVKVHPFGDGSKGATAFLGAADSPGGKWAEQASTPAAAVRKVMAVAQRELAGIGAVLHGFDGEKPMTRLARKQPLALVG